MVPLDVMRPSRRCTERDRRRTASEAATNIPIEPQKTRIRSNDVGIIISPSRLRLDGGREDFGGQGQTLGGEVLEAPRPQAGRLVTADDAPAVIDAKLLVDE